MQAQLGLSKESGSCSNLSTGVTFSNLVFRRITSFCGEWVRGKHRGGNRECQGAPSGARARQEGWREWRGEKWTSWEGSGSKVDRSC